MSNKCNNYHFYQEDRDNRYSVYSICRLSVCKSFDEKFNSVFTRVQSSFTNRWVRTVSIHWIVYSILVFFVFWYNRPTMPILHYELYFFANDPIHHEFCRLFMANSNYLRNITAR